MIAAASFFAAECGPKRVAYIMTRGTLCVALTIALFLVIHNSLNNSPVGERFWITCATIIYLTITDAVIMRGYIKCAHWLLIALYELLAAIVLLHS